MTSTIGKKLINRQKLRYIPPNLVNSGLETAENVGKFLYISSFAIRQPNTHIKHKQTDRQAEKNMNSDTN